MKQFDPGKPYIKKRSITGVYYEQDGCKFTAGYKYAGRLDGKKDEPVAEKTAKEKAGARERARAKIAQKSKKKDDDPLKDFREPETPDAVAGAMKEDAAARKAEENAT